MTESVIHENQLGLLRCPKIRAERYCLSGMSLVSMNMIRSGTNYSQDCINCVPKICVK